MIILSIVAVASCGGDGGATEAGTASVVSVIDGDTVVLDLGGVRESVRLLGIDTPETSHPTRPVECFGAEATERLTELTPPGSTVRVERDVEARDHFGRLLLYLHRVDDDTFVNLALVAEGFATTLHVEPNGSHRAALAAAEADARAAGLGLWGVCGGPGVALDPLASR
ncbi:MAG: thermonuclease family protein [Acidimicrobiales bacterium]